MKNQIKIIFEQDFVSIEKFKGNVVKTAADLNSINKHIPIKNKTDVLTTYRNAERLVREIVMQQTPAFRDLAESNPNILIPVKGEMKALLDKIKGLEIPMVDCLSHAGSEWIINEERTEHECDRFRDIIVSEDQLEKFNVAKAICDLLNRMDRPKREYLLRQVGNLQFMVIAGDPNIVTEANENAKFRPNPAFVLSELHDNYVSSRDLDGGGQLIGIGEIIDTSSRDREPSRLPKNLTDRQKKKLEVDALIYQVARSMD